MKYTKKIIYTMLFLQFSVFSQQITSSIYPIKLIADEISGEKTNLIADSFLSPHKYSLKPSDVELIQNSDVFIWIGPEMMPQLKNHIKDRKGITITISELENIKLIDYDSEHKHSHDDTHNHDNNKTDALEIKKFNPHIWLSTKNAKIIASNIAKQLTKLSPEKKYYFTSNLNSFNNRLDNTKLAISTKLNDFNTDYFIFHNAYAYFEDEFSVKYKGVIRTNPSKEVRLKQVIKLNKLMQKYPNSCLFKEPQFNNKIVEQLANDNNLIVKTLDPIGYSKDKNKTYSDILLDISNSLISCKK